MESGLDLFDPRTSSMDSDSTSSPTAAPVPDFAFAFNDVNFSDRILRIEILSDPMDAPSLQETLAHWATRKSKRQRRDTVREREKAMCNSVTALDINVGPEEQTSECQPSDVGDGLDDEENFEEERIPMIEDSQSGDEDANSNDSDWLEDGSREFRVKTFHISSPILAARSPFFYKLFSNGMKESEQRLVTLRICESEEAAFMELLNFMYSNTLRIDAAPAILDVLVAADKFEVASCIRHCCQLLSNLPMTPESALVYLDLPFSILMSDAVQPLTDAAKKFLAFCYKDVGKYQEEVMKLPLAGIEAVFSSDDLQVGSEDGVYDFILRWAKLHYQNPKERRDVLCSRLGRHIRFPYLTCKKLRKVLSCSDFDHAFATKSVLDALFFKVDRRQQQPPPPHAPDEPATSGNNSNNPASFVERAYRYRPVKVVVFDLPRPQCVVYLDLKREECERLYPSGRVYSQAFHLGGQGFFLSAHCNMDQQSSTPCFGLFLGMQEKGSVTFTVDYEFAARTRSSEEFVSKYKGNYTFTGGKAVGYRNLFSISWSTFMAEDSVYFINGMLHLRAELTVKN